MQKITKEPTRAKLEFKCKRCECEWETDEYGIESYIARIRKAAICPKCHEINEPNER